MRPLTQREEEIAESLAFSLADAMCTRIPCLPTPGRKLVCKKCKRRRPAADGAIERGKPEQIVADYATDLLNQVGADPARLYAAARVACIRAAGEVEYPGRFRPAIRAVDLCRLAAQMAAELQPAT